MEVECPKCEEICEVDGEDLPDCACDDEEFTCPHCEHEFTIGWYAMVEVRQDRV